MLSCDIQNLLVDITYKFNLVAEDTALILVEEDTYIYMRYIYVHEDTYTYT